MSKNPQITGSMRLQSLLTFLILLLIKTLAKIFYRFQLTWSSEKPRDWNQVRLIVFLNHTSLFEPIFTSLFPIHQLYRASKHLLGPGADITLQRPLVGTIYRFLGPNIVPISRKRDQTWQNFLDKITADSLVVILPEGRMKRRTGFDKEGKPMNIRGGVIEVIQKINEGKMLILTSGGLHHIQAPGDYFPKIFKKIKAKLEIVDIKDFLKQHQKESASKSKNEMIHFFEKKLKEKF